MHDVVRLRPIDLRVAQEPLKESYRKDPAAARITLVARGEQRDSPVACSVDLGRTIYEAQAHPGVGGAGSAACSGDLLLGALAACAQLTCQMVAASTGIPLDDVQVTVDGDLDLSGTLGLSRDAKVGFESIRVRFDITAPEASDEQLAALRDRIERPHRKRLPPRHARRFVFSCARKRAAASLPRFAPRCLGVPSGAAETRCRTGPGAARATSS